VFLKIRASSPFFLFRLKSTASPPSGSSPPIIGDADVGIPLELHHQLDGVERVGSRSFTNDGSRVILSFVDTEVGSETMSITLSSIDATGVG